MFVNIKFELTMRLSTKERTTSLANSVTLLKCVSWYRSDNYLCPEIEAAILNLLRKTPKLEFLDLHMEVRCQIISVLCDMLKKRVIRLKTLRLARSLTNFIEFEQFRAEVKACFPVLKVKGRSRMKI